jgi:hypothetical protein
MAASYYSRVKHINTVCGQNTEVPNDAVDGIYNYHTTLDCDFRSSDSTVHVTDVCFLPL